MLGHLKLVRQLLNPLRPLLHLIDVLENFASRPQGDPLLIKLLLGDIEQLLVSELQQDLGVLVQAKGL